MTVVFMSTDMTSHPLVLVVLVILPPEPIVMPAIAAAPALLRSRLALLCGLLQLPEGRGEGVREWGVHTKVRKRLHICYRYPSKLDPGYMLVRYAWQYGMGTHSS
jgi:hypothetical protein